MKATLSDALKQLRLSGLAGSLPVRIEEAQANRLAHAEFLELVLQDELAVRRERQIERRVKAAAFRETKTLDALQIDETMGNLGTSINGGSSKEGSGYAFEVLKRNLSPAMGVLADVVLNPSFPASEFEREKKLAIDGLNQAANSPGAISNRVSMASCNCAFRASSL